MDAVGSQIKMNQESPIDHASVVPTLTLKPDRHVKVRSGYPWIYKDEIETPEIPVTTGSVVRVVTSYGYDLGFGFYNPISTIAIRLLRSSEIPSVAWFEERIRNAQSFRERLIDGRANTAYRLVHGESDFLPGLIVDRYGDYLAIQVFSSGMESFVQQVIQSLCKVFPNVLGVVEKNNVRMRVLEGLPLREGVVWGECPETVTALEHGLALNISILGGQKTGYFLDQKVNRLHLRSLFDGLTVLDCFTNQGGFALNCAVGGASRVLGVDISESSIARSKLNATSNGLTNVDFVKADVFDFLKSQNAEVKKWDVVILDPPSFAKNKKALAQAKRGYAEINRQALKLIPSGGFLVSSSCTHFVSEEMFLDIIKQEAIRINRTLRVVFRGGQSPDHPTLLAMPESNYLKFFVFEVQ